MAKLNFNTEYHQFYICDKKSVKNTSEDFWDEIAYTNRIATGEGIIGVGTSSFGSIRGEIYILEVPSSRNLDEFDHVVQGSLELKSGILQVITCTSSEVVFESTLKSGCYAVIIYSKGLDSIEGDEGNDYYIIEVWPDECKSIEVIKRY